ncbi:MAG: hypothetical protein ACK417_05875 [Bacteroidia bacterium]
MIKGLKWAFKAAHQKGFLSLVVVALLAALLSIWCIRVDASYGIASFTLIPFFIGAAPVVWHGRNKAISAGQAFVRALLCLGIYAAFLVLFLVEGLLCILMAFPIGLFFSWMGSLVGLMLIRQKPGLSTPFMVLLLGSIPGMSFMEREAIITEKPVVTRMPIAASAERIWEEVVAFKPMTAPNNWYFKAGIAYPTHARIEGEGIGAIRYCHFSTGAFVEPITQWAPPYLLAFEVSASPPPMKELHYATLDLPHLHGYFVSKRGEFRIIPIANDQCILQGTTWYALRLKPFGYWQWWADTIVHRIHLRVLEHIKAEAEKPNGLTFYAP